MPNRQTHVVVGTVTGLAASAISSSDLDAQHRWIECAAGALGGAIGGLMPDALEPAVSPNHRSLFHSLAAAGVLSAATMAKWQATCRLRAESCEGRAFAAPAGSQAQNDELTSALLWRAAAGFLVGFLAGYASHLALDASTKRGLPLVVGGF